MRFLGVFALAFVILAGTSAQAIVVKDKSQKVKSNYVKPSVSSSQFSKSTYSSRPSEHYGRKVRSPERIEFKRAPKKDRKRSHISEWP